MMLITIPCLTPKLGRISCRAFKVFFLFNQEVKQLTEQHES